MDFILCCACVMYGSPTHQRIHEPCTQDARVRGFKPDPWQQKLLDIVDAGMLATIKKGSMSVQMRIHLAILCYLFSFLHCIADAGTLATLKKTACTLQCRYKKLHTFGKFLLIIRFFALPPLCNLFILFNLFVSHLF